MYLSNSHSPPSGTWLLGGLVVAISGALMIGFLTPIVSLVSALFSIGLGLQFSTNGGELFFTRLGTINAAAVAIALAMLGAGAFSVDFYLFGRREIIIPDIPRSSK
jgi:uncharacterized membrane protein YphA (DoxX/SURF4 family)